MVRTNRLRTNLLNEGNQESTLTNQELIELHVFLDKEGLNDIFELVGP